MRKATSKIWKKKKNALEFSAILCKIPTLTHQYGPLLPMRSMRYWNIKVKLWDLSMQKILTNWGSKLVHTPKSHVRAWVGDHWQKNGCNFWSTVYMYRSTVCVCLSWPVIISLYGWGCFCVRWYGIWVFMGILFLCLVGCFSMIIWTPTVLSVLHVFCIFVLAPVQHSWACFTWKGALEIRSLILLLLLLYIIIFLKFGTFIHLVIVFQILCSFTKGIHLCFCYCI